MEYHAAISAADDDFFMGEDSKKSEMFTLAPGFNPGLACKVILNGGRRYTIYKLLLAKMPCRGGMFVEK